MSILSRRRLRILGEVHTLLRVLSDPRMVCAGSSRRAVSRLFLDSVKTRSIAPARRLDLIQTKFLNPYIIGRGETFISLTRRGAAMTNVHYKEPQP